MGNSPTANPPASPPMHPAQLLQTLITRAAKDGSSATAYGVTVTPKGRYHYSATKVRISENVAIEMLREGQQVTEATPAPKAKGTGRGPKRTGFAWGSLNAATQAVFYRLAEDIQTATQDHSMQAAARLGHDVRINLVDAPRITNLKKAGLLESLNGAKKSHKFIRLTDEGRRVWFEHTGNA